MLGKISSKPVQRTETKTVPCSAAEARQFDFWVGEWNLSWEKGMLNPAGTGTNVIHALWHGCAIEENFSYPEGSFFGKSFSVYNTRAQSWKQTWVDSSGSYLDFVGTFDGEKMVLSRDTTRPDGQSVKQRMVWYNIAPDKLDWNWERSLDGGKSWEILWTIHYVRKDTIQKK